MTGEPIVVDLEPCPECGAEPGDACEDDGTPCPRYPHRLGCVRGHPEHPADCPCPCECGATPTTIEFRVEHGAHDGHPQITAEWLAHHASLDEAEMRRVMARWKAESPYCRYRLVRVTTTREVIA